MAWVKTTVFRKKLELDVSNNQYINLKQYTSNIAWVDEKVFVNQNSFNVVGMGTDMTNYYGLSYAVANPVGDNIYHTQIGIAVPSNQQQNASYGLISTGGLNYTPHGNNIIHTGIWSGFLAFFTFTNKRNGLTNDCGIEVYASNRLVARHYVKTPDRFLNNFNVAYFVAGTTMTGNIEIRPVGTLKYKVGYEPIVCYNLFIYTVPLTIYNNTGRLIALEGDI